MLVVIVVLSSVQEAELGVGQLFFLRDIFKLGAISSDEFSQLIDDGAGLGI